MGAKLTLRFRLPTREDALRAAGVAWQELGEDGITALQKRTARGESLDGGKFKPYAASTIARKKRLGQQVRPPNLRDTREMLDQELDVLAVELEKGRIWFGFKGDRAKVATFVNALRPFMGFTAAELAKLGPQWVKTFTKALFGRLR
jgi:hypothetical protein